MTIWNAGFPALLSALGYGFVAAALAALFRQPQAGIIGRARWGVLAAVSLQAVLQALLGFGQALHWPVDAPITLAAGISQLGIGISLMPLLQALQPSLARALGARARARVQRADQEANEAASWLELAEQSACFGHFRITLPGRVLEWSDRMYEIHGVTPEQFGPTIEDSLALFHPEDRKSITGSYAVVLAEGGTFDLKVRLRRPDTELRHVILRGRAQGSPAASIIGVMVDITEQKIAEARMKEANMVALHANAALREMTSEDELTGLANRRQFDLSLVAEFKRAVRSTLPLGLVMIDLDHFQTFNEHYGQSAGDACLRRVAQAIKNVPRRTGDLVARYSPKEIVVLLPLADDNGAARVATVIREAVSALHITHMGSETGYLTVSCGTCSFTSLQDLSNPLELVRRADQALYKAKSDGRDRVVRYDASFGAEPRDVYAPAVPQDAGRFIKSRT
jgi:diguanylate cyclase (GGDEF)-like protein